MVNTFLAKHTAFFNHPPSTRLGYNSKVIAEKLTNKQLSGDYNDTLRDVLGVPVTIPPWVEIAISDLYRRVTEQGVSKDSLAEFRRQLQDLGLYPQLPFVADMLEGKDAQAS